MKLWSIASMICFAVGLSTSGLAATSSFVVREDAALTAKLKEGDTFVSTIAGKVVSAKTTFVPVCGPARPGEMTCLGMVAETTINVRFDLGGCLDHLGSVGMTVVRENGEATNIVIAATRIAKKRSIVARCTALPSEVVSFVLRADDIDLEAAEKLVRFVK